MEIIDNFLSQPLYDSFQQMFSKEIFPWYWNHEKTYEDYYPPKVNVIPFCTELENHQFIHAFYLNNERTSNWNIDPLLQHLNPTTVLRAKANLNVHTDEIVRYGFHIDTQHESKTAIYYLNTNNGCTLFEDGTRVDSIGNRLLIFDSKMLHCGTTCTDQKRRMVININYF